MTVRIYFDPADTMIFRDGRPFNQDDAGRATAASLFPPPPIALYGAARVAVARGLGWDGTGDWTNPANFTNDSPPDAAKQCAELLGTWNSDPHCFSISGPFFSVNDDRQNLLPVPSNVVARVSKTSGEVCVAVLRPAKQTFETDGGSRRLVEMPTHDDDLKDGHLAGRWAPEGMVERLLKGMTLRAEEMGGPDANDAWRGQEQRLPGWGPDDLAATESRVGIQRETGTRQVTDGMLYASVRRRLWPGIGMYVETNLPDVRLPRVVPLGGESRFAFVSVRNNVRSASGAATPNPGGRYLVYFTTPVAIDPPRAGADIDGLPGILVALVLPSAPQVQPGLANPERNRVSPGRPVLPAGTVFFMDRSRSTSAAADAIGEATQAGYGRYRIGVWNDG